MKYTYAYKTSDGQRHEATVEAASREAAFTALRARGIKPIKVVAADGSKANGEVVVRGVRRRVVTVLALLVAVVAGAVAFWLGRGGSTSRPQNPTIQQSNNQTISPAAPRHQIYGDPVIVGEIERGKTEAWLSRPADRHLAWFAQPGRLTCPKGTTVYEVRRLPNSVATELEKTLTVDIAIDPTDGREVTELKQIVNGIRAELRDYLKNGNGTIRSFGRRLYERTQEEMQIYERTRRELEKETDPKVWNEKNEALRNLGIRTIPNPKEAE